MGDHKIVYYPTRGYPNIGVSDPRFNDDIVSLGLNRQDINAILSDESIDAKQTTKIAKAFDRRIEMLHLEWRDAIDGNIYKQIEGSDNKLFRILVTKQPTNIRVIFAFFVAGDSEKIILLHAFKEGNKSDYRNAIKKAENRGKALVETGLVRWAE